MSALYGKTAVAGIGLRQYKRGTSPLPERGVLAEAIIDVCVDQGLTPPTLMVLFLW